MLIRALQLTGLFAWAAISAPADTLVLWDFDSKSEPPGELSPASVNPGMKASDVGVLDTTDLVEEDWTGIFVKPARGSVSGEYMITAKRWHGEALSTNYFSFTLTPEPRHRLSITAIQFYQRANPTEFTPTNWALYASSDDFFTPLATGKIPQDSTWLTVTRITDLPGMTDLQEAVEFRLVATGATSANSNWFLDDLSVEGEITFSQ